MVSQLVSTLQIQRVCLLLGFRFFDSSMSKNKNMYMQLFARYHKQKHVADVQEAEQIHISIFWGLSSRYLKPLVAERIMKPTLVIDESSIYIREQFSSIRGGYWSCSHRNIKDVRLHEVSFSSTTTAVAMYSGLCIRGVFPTFNCIIYFFIFLGLF